MPKDERPEGRNPAAFRVRNDSLAELEAKATALSLSRNRLAEIAIEAIALDSVRCYRCGEKVELILGNLAGKTLGEWLAEVEVRAAQLHPDHAPLRLGTPAEAPAEAGLDEKIAEAVRREVAKVVPAAEPALVGANGHSRSPAELRDDLQAAGHPVVVASELPAPGTAVFQPPGEDRTVEFETPREVPAADRKRGRGKTCPHRVPAGSYCRTCGRLV